MLDKHHHITYNYEKLSRCTDLTIKDHLEATDRVLQGHQFALGSGEDLGNLELSAQHYLLEQGIESPLWRIDVVAVELDGTGKLLRCEHTENALAEW